MIIREYENITARVKKLRNNMTPSERQVWGIHKGRQILGQIFRRQHPIVVETDKTGYKTYYIVDFYCTSLKMAIEIDGPIHYEQRQYDEKRDRLLSQKGIVVIRILNEEVTQISSLTERIQNVLQERMKSMRM